MANLFFKDTDPSPQTLGEASWLYQDIMKTFSTAVQNGVAKAFKGKE